MRYRDALWILKLRNVKVSKMTMKRQKTLHRFAAVAAVLLAFCLVFMMPAAAEGTVSTADVLQDAFDVGGEITLGADITVTETLTIPKDKEVTLDLAGYTISQTKECTGSYSMIVNKGSLTIINSQGEGKISFKDISNPGGGSAWSAYTIDIREGGSLIVEGGTIENLGEQAGNAQNAIFIYDGSVEINDGAFNVPYSRTVRLWTGSLTINGGTFDGQVWVQTGDSKMSTTYGVLNINGGDFAPGSCGNDGSSVFITNERADVVQLSVTGGNFATKIGVSDATRDGVAGSIIGGTFTDSAKGGTNTGLLKTGYEFVDTGDNEWKVSADSASRVAEINGIGYTSIADAVSAAKDGDTITVLKDVVLNDIIAINKKLTITANGDVTISSNAGKIFEVYKDADFQNLKLVNSANGGRCIDTRVGGITVNINNCVLTTTSAGNNQPLTIGGKDNSGLSVTLSGTTINADDAGYGIITFVPVNLNIQDKSSITGYAALYLKESGSVDVKGGSTLTGLNQYTVESQSSFGVIVIEASDVTVTLSEDSTAGYAETSNSAEEAIILFNKNDITGSSVTINEGVSLTKNGDNAIFATNAKEGEITVNAGVTSNFLIDSVYLADGCECVGSGNAWTVQIQTFSVQFDSKEGTTVGSQSIEYGNPVVRPADPTKEGYTFAGWYLSEMLYDFTTLVTEDITLTAEWNENGKPVTITPTISVEITVEQDGKTTIPTSTEDATTTVEFSGTETAEPVAVITDKTTGVQMVVNFGDDAAETEDGVSGTVTSVEVKYPEAPAESEGDIKQEVNFVMNNPDDKDKLPKIDSKKDDTVVEKVKKQEQRANVLAMITATRDNLEELKELNENIDTVTITFRVHASLISNPHNLQGYHVDDNSDDITAVITQYSGKDGEYHVFTITSKLGFSSYVLVEEPQKSSGSAVDTGSGNYQYYPRSVPTDGIVDFGTSKVVTGMELPAGSDGTVTLNIKPTFAMPENGFYAFEIDAPGYNLDAKINGGLSFQIPVADLEAAGWTAEDIVLFHGTVGEDGKITWEALPTNLVKNENGVAYYKAAINGCSPFYIGFVKDGSVVNTEVVDPVTPETPETPVTPDEPEVLPPVDEPETPEQPTESPAPILAVLAGLGAAVVLRRK